jgi:single-strand DNA-binding protein
MPSELRMPDTRAVIVAGRLGNVPDLKRSANDVAWCSLRLAVTLYRGRDKDKDTLWLDVDCFGVAAEFACRCEKGAPVLVEGNLDVARWKDKSGEDRSKVVVKANRVQRLDWDEKDASGGGFAAERTDGTKPRSVTTEPPARGERKRAAEPAADDDLPF